MNSVLSAGLRVPCLQHTPRLRTPCALGGWFSALVNHSSVGSDLFAAKHSCSGCQALEPFTDGNSISLAGEPHAQHQPSAWK